MTNPYVTPVDERLRAVLLGAMERDPNVLNNADHLHALLADLAPDMPPGLRNACVAVVRTKAVNWLTQTPPYSEEQVVTWLRAQYPDVTPDVGHQAVAAVAQLSGARPAPGPTPAAPAVTPSPVFDQPTVAGSVAEAAAAHPSFPPVTSQPTGQYPPVPPQPTGQFPPVPAQPTVGSMQTEMPMHPSFPPPHASWPPPPPPAEKKGRKTAIILAVVAVLLIGGGVAAFFAFKGGEGGTQLAAPRNVSAKLDGFGAVAVTWQPVDGADHYTISDLTGALDDTDVEGTSHVFSGAAKDNHRFVVQAVTADGDAGATSAPAPWAKQNPIVAPQNFSVSASGNGLHLTWDAVDGATTYRLVDLENGAFGPDPISETSYDVLQAVYTTHRFQVSAVSGTEAGPGATVTWTPDHELSADQATLAYKLPSDMVKLGSCSADTADEDKSTFVSAAVSCDPVPGARDDGPPVLFALQLKPGTQNAFETDHFGHFESRVGCENSYPAAGTQSTWELSNKTIGDEFCFRASNGTSVFAWTYYDDNVCIQIEGQPPASRTGLHEWWGHHVTLLQ